MAKFDLVAQANALMSLLAGLHRGERILVTEIAERLGTDAKLTARLLATLQESGVPPFGGGDTVDIIIDGEGDEAVLEVYAPLPALGRAVRLTDEQTAALVMALMMAGIGYREPLTSKILASCATDFNATLFERQLRITTPDTDSEIDQTVAFALEKGYGLDIVYVNRLAERSERTIEPLKKFREGETNYVTGFCLRDEKIKIFRINAMESARVNRSVVIRKTLEERAQAEGRAPETYLQAIDRATAEVAHIEFASALDLWRQDWPNLGDEKMMVNGAIRATIPLLNESWVARKIAGYGGRVKVLSPDSLRREVVACARELRSALLEG